MFRLVDKIVLGITVIAIVAIGTMLRMPVVPYRIIGFTSLLFFVPLIDLMVKVHIMFVDNTSFLHSHNLIIEQQMHLYKELKGHNEYIDKMFDLQAKTLADMTQIAVAKETTQENKASN